MDLEGKIRTFLDVDVFEVLSFFPVWEDAG